MSLPANSKESLAIPDNFLELQRELYMLKPIHTKRDYRKAVKVAEKLAAREDLTKTQAEYLESLPNSIEIYEKEKYSMNDHGPVETLKFLLEENSLSGSDLGRILGNRTLGHAILSGKRQLSKTHISRLSRRFSVNPGLFL